MHWAATDQFGNLYIGASDASTLEELRPHIASLVEELHARTEGDFKITIDMDYTEINGPDPDRVSHILQVPHLTSLHTDSSPEAIRMEVEALVHEACQQQGIGNAQVKLA